MNNINSELLGSFIKEVELKFDQSSVFSGYSKNLSMKENFLNFNKYLNSILEYNVNHSTLEKQIYMYIPNAAYVLYANGYSCKDVADFLCQSQFTFFINGNMKNSRYGKSIDTDYLFSMLMSDMGSYYDTLSYFYNIKDEILNTDYRYKDILILIHFIDSLRVYQNASAERENINCYISLLKFIAGINYKTYFVKATDTIVVKDEGDDFPANKVAEYLKLDNEETIDELTNTEFGIVIGTILSPSIYSPKYFEDICESYNCYPFQHLMSKDLNVIKEFLEMNLEEIKDDKVKEVLKYIDVELAYRKSKGILL